MSSARADPQCRKAAATPIPASRKMPTKHSPLTQPSYRIMDAHSCGISGLNHVGEEKRSERARDDLAKCADTKSNGTLAAACPGTSPSPVHRRHVRGRDNHDVRVATGGCSHILSEATHSTRRIHWDTGREPRYNQCTLSSAHLRCVRAPNVKAYRLILG